VSSGAVGAGMGQFGWKRRPDNLPQLQAAAAVGQAYLIRAYDEGLRRHRRHAAQLLLTHEDFDSRPRYLNMRNTLHALFECDAVPIINENDTISVDEIKFGDNDRLAAMVTELVSADLLVLLSDVDGFYENWENKEKRRLIPHIKKIDESMRGEAKTEGSKHSTGGMRTKLDAAQMCGEHGVHMVLASGSDPDILLRILAGEEVGSFFESCEPALRGRKYWLTHHLVPHGLVLIDDGAVAAIRSHGKSLLPGGIVEVRGNFAAGDGLDIAGLNGIPFARGISNYGREELVRIQGHKSSEIPAILGTHSYDEVVHRDNMSMLS